MREILASDPTRPSASMIEACRPKNMTDRPRVWTTRGFPRYARPAETLAMIVPHADPLANALEFLRISEATYHYSSLAAPWGLLIADAWRSFML